MSCAFCRMMSLAFQTMQRLVSLKKILGVQWRRSCLPSQSTQLQQLHSGRCADEISFSCQVYCVLSMKNYFKSMLCMLPGSCTVLLPPLACTESVSNGCATMKTRSSSSVSFTCAFHAKNVIPMQNYCIEQCQRSCRSCPACTEFSTHMYI